MVSRVLTKGNSIAAYKLMNRSQIITRRSHLSREDRLFSLSSHSSPAVNLPMDDDVRSILYFVWFDLVV